MIAECKKIEVDASFRIAHSYSSAKPLAEVIQMLQEAETFALQRGLTDIRFKVATDEDNDYAFVQLVGYRDETDSEMKRRIDRQTEWEKAHILQEREQLKQLMEKYKHEL